MKKLVAVITALAAVIALALPAFANSAELPSISVIVNGAPYDLDVRLGLEDGDIAAPTRMKRNNEDYIFEFFRNGSYEKLIVSYGGESFEVPCSWRDYGYHPIVTLNLKERTVTEGSPAIRTVPLIILRIALTLLIEGGIFYLFGYRKKRSWIIFVITNLVTQGALNVVLAGRNFVYLWFIALFVLEILIWLFETLVFVIFLKEKQKLEAVVYTFLANLASLVLGGVLIGMMRFDRI